MTKAKPKEKFNTKSKAKEEHKLLCNKLFVREAVKNIGPALILDAEDLKTTTFLKRRGFKNIIVPNPYVFDKIKSTRRATAVDMLVGEYLEKNPDIHRYSAVWLDYCASFDGNAEMKPQEDIKLLFNKQKISNNSTLAVTFSFRKHQRVDYVGQDEDRVRKCLTNEARLNGYTLVFERTHKYTGMFFILCRVYEND